LEFSKTVPLKLAQNQVFLKEKMSYIGLGGIFWFEIIKN